MESQRPLSRPRRARAQARPRRTPTPSAWPSSRTSRAGCATLAGRRRRRARAGRGGQALRGAGGPARPADLLCLAGLCRQHHRSGCAPSSMATCRSASPPPRCICCSSRSSSTASTTPCSTPPWRDPALGHYRPWIEDVRKEKPYQLEDRVEQLFHEKSVTGYSAWNRQYDETIAGLRFKIGGKAARRSSRRSICCRTPTARSARRRRRRWPRPSRTTCGRSR